MYFLALSTQYWYDSVVYGILKNVKSWDIVQDTQNTYLCLGEDISFPHLYDKKKTYNFIEPQIIAKQLFHENTFKIIHWMVEQYFSSYKATVSLFLPRNESFIKKRESGKKQKKVKTNTQQKCWIYPNLWALTQDKKISDWTQPILHGWMSITQKQKYFIEIQSWEIETFFATNRGLFFDWQNLTEIHLFDKDNRSYSAKNDPRFILSETATFIADIYNAKLYL